MTPLLPPLPPLTAQQAVSNAREHRQRHTHHWTRSALQITTLFTVLVVGAIAHYKSTQLSFNSALWKSSRTKHLSTRDRMCSNLIHSQKLKGLTHTQVISLLGQPNDYHVGEWTMAYTIASYPLDSIALVIKFDGQKKVTAYEVQTFS